jgi:hypothetical protein
MTPFSPMWCNNDPDKTHRRNSFMAPFLHGETGKPKQYFLI